MEVIKTNFKDILPEITKDIEECCFMSIDGEFTGLSNERNILPFDTSKEYYEKRLRTSSGFILIQLGITFFKKTEDTEEVKLKSYNIFVLPRYKNAVFSCQEDCLSFLTSNGFDFNKLFSLGISYCNEIVEDKLRNDFKDRQANRAEQLKQRISEEEKDTSGRNFLPVPENEQDFINDARERIQKVVDNNLLDTSFEKSNAFQRKLIYELIERDFNNKVSTTTKTLENNRKALVVSTKRTIEDEIKLDEDRTRKEESALIDSIGLRLLMKEISSSKKLIIGHNCLLDIMYLTMQCFQDLPDDYDKFKKLIHGIYPNIIDTKFIANSEKFKEIFSSSVLNQVYERLLSSPFKPVSIKWENEYQTYDLSKPKEHEAGFDSFLTGYCFLVILDHLHVKLEPKFEKCKELVPFLNRIALQRIATPYIYLTGNEPTFSRSHVFYIKFPPTWQTSDIQDHFKNYGPVQISWVDSTSGFVSLYNKENSSCVIKTIAKPKGFDIKSFADFHSESQRTQLKRKKEDSDTDISSSKTSENSSIKSKIKRAKNSFEESNNWKRTVYISITILIASIIVAYRLHDKI